MPWFFLLAQSTEWMYNFTRSAIHFYLRSLASQPASHRCCVAKPRLASLCGASCAREQKAKETSKWLFTQIFETFCKGKNWFFFVYGSEKKPAFLNGNFCERIQIKRWKQWWCWFFFVLFYSIVLQVANVCYFQAMDVSAYLEMKR